MNLGHSRFTLNYPTGWAGVGFHAEIVACNRLGLYVLKSELAGDTKREAFMHLKAEVMERQAVMLGRRLYTEEKVAGHDDDGVALLPAYCADA